MKTWLGLSLLIILALGLGGCQVSEDQLESMINNMGYTLIQPPSNLYGPVTFVFRSNYDPQDKNSKALTLGFLCNPNYSVALYAGKPLSSPTSNQATVTKFGGSISAGIPALARLVDISAKLGAGKNITADIHDVNIYTFGLDDLEAIRDFLGPKCRAIINRNVPLNAFQVREVLQATVDVTVEVNGEASVSAKAQFIRQLGNLGFTLSGTQSATLSGKALFYGVRLEPIVTPLSPPAATSPALISKSAPGDSTKVALDSHFIRKVDARRHAQPLANFFALAH